MIAENSKENGKVEEVPKLSGKDMNALMYLLIKKVGMVEIPQEVFDTAPEPEKLKIEMQWDGVNRIWRFFLKRKPSKRNRKPKLALPNKKLVLPN